MSNRRKPSQKEERLIEALVSRSNLKMGEGWKETLLVESMSDGGMGSLRLFPEGRVTGKRLLGTVASEIKFEDEDGVEVSVTLNVDKDGELLEVDSWKVDFSTLIRIPDHF